MEPIHKKNAALACPAHLRARPPSLTTAPRHTQVLHTANPAALVQVLSQLEQLTDPVYTPPPPTPKPPAICMHHLAALPHCRRPTRPARLRLPDHPLTRPPIHAHASSQGQHQAYIHHTIKSLILTPSETSFGDGVDAHAPDVMGMLCCLLTVGTVPASENTFDCARQYLMGLAERAPRQVCQYVEIINFNSIFIINQIEI